MKTITSLLIVGSLMTVACGPTKNNPLENYKHLNLSENAQNAGQNVKYLSVKGDDVVLKTTEYVEVKTEVPVIQEKAVYIVDCPESLLKENEGSYKACRDSLKVTADQISIDGPVYEIKTYSDVKLQKQEALIFTEGQESTYYISAKNLFKADVKFSLNIEDYPQNALVSKVSEKTNESLYKITWTPSKGLVKAGETDSRAMIKASLEDIQYVDASENKNYVMKITFDAISKVSEKEIIVKKVKQEQKTTAPQAPAAKTALGGDRR